MKKLYKTIDGVLHYKEAWSHDGDCTFHWGVVGNTGESETYLIDGDTLKEPAVDNVLAEAIAEGYREIAPEDQYQIVVQYKTAGGWGDTTDLEKRYHVEDILDECLGWTGNGHCDGGDIGSGTINAFAFVVAPKTACDTIVEELHGQDLLDGAVIAYRNQNDEYDVLWPPDFEGTFSII